MSYYVHNRTRQAYYRTNYWTHLATRCPCKVTLKPAGHFYQVIALDCPVSYLSQAQWDQLMLDPDFSEVPLIRGKQVGKIYMDYLFILRREPPPCKLSAPVPK